MSKIPRSYTFEFGLDVSADQYDRLEKATKEENGIAKPTKDDVQDFVYALIMREIDNM